MMTMTSRIGTGDSDGEPLSTMTANGWRKLALTVILLSLLMNYVIVRVSSLTSSPILGTLQIKWLSKDDASIYSSEENKHYQPPAIYVFPGNWTPANHKKQRTYFQLETELLEGLRQRGRIVNDPDQATHFWIPHSLVSNWIDKGKNYERIIQKYLNTTLRPFLEHMYYDLPYFNRSQGKDHVFVYVMDMGPICEKGYGAKFLSQDPFFQTTIFPMRKVGYYGQRNLNSSVSGVPCWDDNIDIEMPQWHTWDMRDDAFLEQAAANCSVIASPFLTSLSPPPSLPSCNGWAKYLQKRALRAHRAFYFRGTITPGHQCSTRIRPWMRSYCTRVHAEHCIFKPENESTSMQEAVFALSPAGFACWSSRLYDAFHQIVIPVILADDMVLPFEHQLNYSSFVEVVETGSPTRLPRDGGPAFQRLVDLSESWISTCRNETQRQDCILHPVSQKMNAIARHRRYWGWQKDDDENAFALFERELMRSYRSLDSTH